MTLNLTERGDCQRPCAPDEKTVVYDRYRASKQPLFEDTGVEGEIQCSP